MNEEPINMGFVKVYWRHELSDQPTELYAELDDQRWEVRKVDVFRDGRMTWADERRFTGNSGLGLVPTPELDELAQDPQFQPAEISGEEFEDVWRQALSATNQQDVRGPY